MKRRKTYVIRNEDEGWTMVPQPFDEKPIQWTEATATPVAPEIASNIRFLIDRGWEILCPLLDDAKFDYVLKANHAAAVDEARSLNPRQR